MNLIPPESGTTTLPAATVNLTDRALYAVVSQNTNPDPAWGSRNQQFEQEVLRLTNEHRETAKRYPLRLDGNLGQCAGWKALHMSGYGYMSHDDPAPPVARSTGQRFTDFNAHVGMWGENIAYGYSSPEAVVNGWINSPGHRANLENSTFKFIGVGAAHKSGPWYWAQCFGSQAASGPPPEEEPPTPPPPPPPASKQLQFSDRHAIGVLWDTAYFAGSDRLDLYVGTPTGTWTKVRDVPNNGNTYVTYPLTWSGQGKVRLTGGNVSLEGTFQVRPFS